MTALTTLPYDLRLVQGKTFTVSFRWAAPPYIYAAITAIAQTAPLRLTVPTHGMPDGWRFAVAGVGGMTSLNASADPPRQRDFFTGTVVDTNTIDVNDVNGTLLSAYTSGGHIQFYTPVDMAAMTARMMIRDKVGGTVLWEGTSDVGDIAIDTAKAQVVITVDSVSTAALADLRGVYDIEMVTDGGADPDVVNLLASGRVFVEREASHAD